MHSIVSKCTEGGILGVPLLNENCPTVDLAKINLWYFEGGPLVISAVHSWAALKVPDPLLPQPMMLGQEIHESLGTERN